jgi:hypothetical protein
MSDVETEVRQHLATDPHYPLGEQDAMKWAIAFRLLREGRGDGELAPDDSEMVGWFANAMVSDETMAAGGSFLNADGMQDILDGKLDPHPEFGR